MYCSNCGKEVKENDNFCRFCGVNLHAAEEGVEQKINNEENVSDEIEEIVLYDVEKHWMNLVVPIFLIPLFFFYFWNIFLNTHSFFSWVIMLALLGFIFYPIARYKSDRIVITNKFAHIKSGIINPLECDVPIDALEQIEVSQSSMGKMFDYGSAVYSDKNDTIDYGYIKSPGELQYIIKNPDKFIEENMD